MSITVVKFETYIKQAQRQDPAYTTFQNSLATLSTPLFFYQVYTINPDGTTDSNGGLIIHGLILPSQAANALALLTALNTALTSNGLGTVMCVSYQVALQP